MKRIVALSLVIVMLVSATGVAYASTPGGITDFSGLRLPGLAGALFGSEDISGDMYLSDTITRALLNAMNEYDPTPSAKGIIENIFTSGLSDLDIVLYIYRYIGGYLLRSASSAIRTANQSGNGVIITFSGRAGVSPTARSQGSTANPTTQRAIISVNVSPNNGGRTAGSGNYEVGQRAQLWAYPNSGWQFDGWYEGNTRVSQNTTWSFTVERNRTFEARFRQGSSGSTPSQPALSVVSSSDGDFRVTIPANTTVYGYSSSTTTSRTMLYSPRASFTLYCTRRLTMSDGTTRYLFRSGGDTARDWYLQFTSAMSVIEESAPISTPTPTPTPPSMPNQIAWDTSSVIASATLQAGRTYEILIDGVRQVMISTNSSNERRFDYVRYGADGRAWANGENTYTNYQLNPTDGEIYRITVRSDDIRITIPSEYANSTIITETTIPALYFFTLEARQSYRITNDASYQIMIYTNSNNERRFDYVRYDANGRAWATGENTYTNYPLNPTSGERYDITVRENDIPCYVVYEQAAFLSGIPTPSGGYIR